MPFCAPAGNPGELARRPEQYEILRFVGALAVVIISGPSLLLPRSWPQGRGLGLYGWRGGGYGVVWC